MGYCTILRSATCDGKSVCCMTRLGIAVLQGISLCMACTAVSLTARKVSLLTIHSHIQTVSDCHMVRPAQIVSWLTLNLRLKNSNMLGLQTLRVAISARSRRIIEAIMPTSVQALQRKRSEKKRGEWRLCLWHLTPSI